MDEFLVFIKEYCKNTNGTYEYDFFFSDAPEFVWGPDWDINSPISNGDITPDSTTYNKIRRVITDLPLKVISQTTCYSMEYATYGIMALSWIDIENLDVYPEHGRLTMYFGETENEIINKLSKYSWNFRD